VRKSFIAKILVAMLLIVVLSSNFANAVELFIGATEKLSEEFFQSSESTELAIDNVDVENTDIEINNTGVEPMIQTGAFHSVALKSDGTVWASRKE
jgi:hypothetical protein